MIEDSTDNRPKVVTEFDDIPEEMRTFITTPHPHQKGYPDEAPSYLEYLAREQEASEENIRQLAHEEELQTIMLQDEIQRESQVTNKVTLSAHSQSYTVEFPPENKGDNEEQISVQEAEEQQLALSLSASMILRKRDSSEISKENLELVEDKEGKKVKLEGEEHSPWCSTLDDIGKFCLRLFSKAEEAGLTMPPPPNYLHKLELLWSGGCHNQ